MNSFNLLIQAIRAYLGLNSSGLETLKSASAPQLAGFIELVEKHNAQAYVLQGLKNANLVSSLPEDAAESLQYGADCTAEESLRLTRALHQAHGTLSSAGIDIIPFKGPIFSMRTTGGLSHRPFTDIDVLVRREDVPKALGVLTDAGYREFFQGSIPVTRRTLRNNCEIELLDPDDNIIDPE